MAVPRFIKGDPYPARKAGGNEAAPDAWFNAIVNQTRDMVPVKDPCRLDVEFILNKRRFTDDVPYGTDLDNLLELLFDAWGETVFRTAKRKDSVIVEVHAIKRWAKEGELAGAIIQVSPRSWP